MVQDNPAMNEYLSELNETRIPAAMPPNYYDPGLTRKMLHDEIQENIS